ncbi:MAG TPA: hypothetical protein VF824_16710 [Thermoanaerobaculia bacterium]|jgi:hypothetical protein
MIIAAAVSLLLATNWQQDVSVFARELPKRHANAFHDVSRDELARAMAALQAKAAAGADDDAMFVELSRVAAMVGDGHTYVRIPQNAHRLPLGVTKFGDDYRVTHTIEPYRAILGTRLVRIESTPIADAAARMQSLIPQHENDVLFAARTPMFLTLGEALHGSGIAPSHDRATFTFARDDGSEVSVDVAAVPWSQTPQWIFATSKPPRSTQRTSEAFWFEPLEPNAVYVMFRRYDDLRAKSRELWSYVDAHKIEKLILDLRVNGGGDYTKGREFLVDEIRKRPKLRVYALVGANTFSAAMTNAVDLRKAGAKLVGTTIGERPNSYQENDEFTLPSSKLVVSYSTRLYKFVADDAPNVVEPDQEARATWADYLAGRDPAVEWALAQ